MNILLILAIVSTLTYNITKKLSNGKVSTCLALLSILVGSLTQILLIFWLDWPYRVVATLNILLAGLITILSEKDLKINKFLIWGKNITSIIILVMFVENLFWGSSIPFFHFQH